MSNVFKAYDIRAVYGKELTDDIVFKVGLALGKYFDNDEYIGIVRDIRLSSPRIRDILVEALLYTHNVIDFGIGSTPEAHYLARYYGIPILMITASHDPPEYNGIKPINNDGYDFSVDSSQIKELEKIYNEIDIGNLPSNKIGTLEYDYYGIDEYKKYLKRKFRNLNGYRIGYDPSNSVMALFYDVLIDLGNDVYVINGNLDGSFPSHLPNPADPKNLQQLAEFVKSKKLDFGFAFDGDGDRIGIVDGDGNIFPPYKYLLAFFRNRKNKKFVVEISLPMFLRKLLGDKCILSRTGHTFVIQKSIESKAYMGIEFSGHVYPSENSYIDDAFYAGLMLIKEFRKYNFWFNDVEIPKFEYKEFHVPLENYNGNLVRKAIEYGKNRGYELNDMNGLLFDGIELIKDNYRLLVRKSQTENIYRVIIESYDENINVNNLFNELLSF